MIHTVNEVQRHDSMHVGIVYIHASVRICRACVHECVHV